MSTEVTSEKCCQDRKVCQVSSFRAAKGNGWKGCQEQEMSRANRIKRKCKHQKRMSREWEVKEKEASKQRGGTDVVRERAVKFVRDVTVMEMRYALVK